jgi:hypothetical protein
MPTKSIEERLEELEGKFGKLDNRIEVFINGEKDLGAKGALERLMKMEDAYRQYEGLIKIFEWIDKLIGWAKYIIPLIGAAMAFTHYNFHGTNEVLHK